MTTKFNVGDTVYVKGLVTNIQIDLENRVLYKVRFDDPDGRTGYIYMAEEYVIRKEDTKCQNK